jgi:hypothetical protein
MSFNPEEFLASATIEGANSTEVIPCPEGVREVLIEEVKPRQWTGKKDPTKSGVALDLKLKVLDPEALHITKRDPLYLNFSIMLDTTDEGKLDNSEGANVALGQAREACNINKPGQFNLMQFVGQTARAVVQHESAEINGMDTIVARVKRLVKA